MKERQSRSWLWIIIFGSLVVVGIVLLITLLAKCSSTRQDETETIPAVPEDTTAVLDPIIQEIIDNMICLDGGAFQMGSEDSIAEDDEKPVHPVEVSSFCISNHEVTQKEWICLMDTNPSFHQDMNLPVEKVSWDDCQEFISKLNEKTGMQFRLPTEAEWEYAARGGRHQDSLLYAGSNTLSNVGWYKDNSEGKTHNVGQKSPNSLGLYDMSGNVWEWCQDSYDEPSNRVLRGGSWVNDTSFCRVSKRFYSTQGNRGLALGLRLALFVLK